MNKCVTGYRFITAFFSFILLIPALLVAQPMWVQSNNGGLTDPVAAITTTPNNEVYVAAAGSGVFKSTNNGVDFFPVNGGLDAGVALSIAANAEGDVFVGTSEGVYRSTNAGVNWTNINTGLGNEAETIAGIAITANGTLYVATANGVFRSTDNGSVWIATALTVQAISIAVGSDGKIYAAGVLEGVYTSTDDGATWQPSTTPIQGIVAMAGNASGDMFVISSNTHRSTDGGATWEIVHESSFTSGVAIDRSPVQAIYIATSDIGVLVSYDNGDTWQELNEGLNGQLPYALHASANGVLYAGTFSGLLYHATAPTSSVHTTNSTEQNLQSLTCYPNPAKKQTTVRFILTNSSQVSIRVVNMLGETVHVYSAYKEAGQCTIPLLFTDMPSGSYVVVVEAVGNTMADQIQIGR